MAERFNFKCCKPLPTSTKCDAKTRKLSNSIIEKLKSHGCKKSLDISMHICSKCYPRVYRLSSNSADPSNESVEDMETDKTPTSGAESVPADIESESVLEVVPSATSLESSSSADSDIKNIKLAHNIETFNNGIKGINVSPISAKKN